MERGLTEDERRLLQTLDALKKLEHNHIKRDKLLRKEERWVRFRWDMLAIFWASLGAMSIGFFRLSELTESLESEELPECLSVIVPIFAVFAVIYHGMQCLWEMPMMKGLQERMKTPIHKKFRASLLEVNLNSRKILAKLELKDLGIPNCYLSIQALNLLERYFRFGQASTLHTALIMMEYDMIQTDDLTFLENQENLVDMEHEALEQFEGKGVAM